MKKVAPAQKLGLAGDRVLSSAFGWKVRGFNRRIGHGVCFLVLLAYRANAQQNEQGRSPPAVPGAATAPAAKQAPAQAETNKAAGRSPQPLVVTVEGEKADERGQPMPSRTARITSGTFGDAFRAVESLPGVSPAIGGLGYFFVRGAPPANTGYFVDGVRVPSLFHFGPQPSIFPTSLISDVEFYPGVAPTRFGRFTGGIVSGNFKPPSPVLRGEASLRWFDTSALLEVPLWGENSSIAVAGRYGYPNILLDTFDVGISLEYWDYTVRAQQALSQRDILSIFAFGAYDRLMQAREESDISTRFHRFDLRYDRLLDRGHFRLAATQGVDQTERGGSQRLRREGTNAASTRLRAELKYNFSPTISLETGGDTNSALYNYSLAALGKTLGVEARSTLAISGVYAELTLQPFEGWQFIPGLRADHYRTAGASELAIDPNLSVRVKQTAWLTWAVGAGISHQEPTRFIPVPGFDSGLKDGLQQVTRLALGPEIKLPLGFEAEIKGFYAGYTNTSDYVSTCGTLDGLCDAVERTSGKTWGAELLLERPLTGGNRYGGWLSYTLARGERQAGNRPYLSPFDRTHVLALVGGYRLGKGYLAGTRLTYYSGRPEVPHLQLANLTEVTLSTRPDMVTQHRLPDYFRLDVRVEKRWSLPEGASIAVVLDWFNASLSKEAVEYVCQSDGWCRAKRLPPITLPSIGVEGNF